MEVHSEIADLPSSIGTVIKSILGHPEDIASERKLSELGLDSIKSVQLIVELEEKFNIMFEEEELLFEHFATIQQIALLIYGKLG